MVQYSINKYIDQLADDHPSKLYRKLLTLRDLLDKIPQEKLIELLHESTEVVNLTPEEKVAQEALQNFCVSKKSFDQLAFNQESNATFLEQSWSLLLNLALQHKEVFNSSNQATLDFIADLEQSEKEKDYSFTNHYINTKLELGVDIPLLPYTGNTEIFIHPGHKVHLVDHIVTNFHLPKSTLIMLVAGFIGFDYCLKAYNHAIAQKYRFYSYGDSSFIPNLLGNEEIEYLL
nr:S-adenosylmethionine:tRNA ribosyltransferase-isomerase [Psittacicella hinzii]